MGGFFFEFEAIRTASSDRDAPRRSKAAPEPLKLQLAALDSEARALVDFVVWNLCAVEKISKKRDKLFPEVLSQRRC
jgi:SPX domain protein involved in polyphosphate accumulation